MVVAQKLPVVLGAELSRNQTILSVRKDHGTISVVVVQDLHIVLSICQIYLNLSGLRSLDGFHEDGMFAVRRLDDRQ